jgi:hypothetical protein
MEASEPRSAVFVTSQVVPTELATRVAPQVSEERKPEPQVHEQRAGTEGESNFLSYGLIAATILGCAYIGWKVFRKAAPEITEVAEESLREVANM